MGQEATLVESRQSRSLCYLLNREVKCEYLGNDYPDRGNIFCMLVSYQGKREVGIVITMASERMEDLTSNTKKKQSSWVIAGLESELLLPQFKP